MVKRWLSTFAEQPSPAALQVVAEDLGERMRCSHDLGRQRGGFLRSGACSSRTGADGDRRQRASVSSARAGHSDSMDCLVLLRSSAATATSCRCCKTKEHRSLQRRELFTRGLKSGTATDRGCARIEEQRPCAAECAFGASLRRPQPSHNTLYEKVGCLRG